MNEKKTDAEAKKNNELIDNLWRDDVAHVLSSPQGRRFVHYLLSPDCTNLMGPNGGEREAAIRLMSQLVKAEPKVMEILYKHKEEDEYEFSS
jgi:hypothetical protein